MNHERQSDSHCSFVMSSSGKQGYQSSWHHRFLWSLMAVSFSAPASIADFVACAWVYALQWSSNSSSRHVQAWSLHPPPPLTNPCPLPHLCLHLLAPPFSSIFLSTSYIHALVVLSHIRRRQGASMVAGCAQNGVGAPQAKTC